MKTSLTCIAALVALGLNIAGTAHAQTAGTPPQKSLAIEAVAPFPVFERWVTTVIVVPVEEAPPTQAVPWAAPAVAGTPFQPRPVILGLPDLPLMGAGVTQAASSWGSSLNYQGVQMRLVVINPANGKRELRSLSTGVRQGERFKLRILSSFDGVADVDQIVGDGWALQRANRAYPGKDQSVQIKASQTLDIPVQPNEYFTFNGDRVNDRVVLSVRHAKAAGAAGSNQPVYRQEGRIASNYLQLVPRGQYPLIEQLITMRR